jgi:hypothetical protein
MPLSTQDAASALDDIADVQHRASVLNGYQQGAPHFFLWGTIWFIGYAATDLWPQWAWAVWLALDVGGMTGSFLLGSASMSRSGVSSAGYGRRFSATSLAIVALIAATFYILAPTKAAQFGAFPALVIAALYTGFGIWRGTRWAVAGMVLGACTVGGYALFKEHFNLWLAASGAATLLLSGAWLRRA